MIEEQQFNNWLEDPVTKQLFESIKENRENALHELSFIPNSDNRNADLALSFKTGAITVLSDLLNITYQDVIDKVPELESQGGENV